jgi:hypothetical protein
LDGGQRAGQQKRPGRALIERRQPEDVLGRLQVNDLLPPNPDRPQAVPEVGIEEVAGVTQILLNGH